MTAEEEEALAYKAAKEAFVSGHAGGPFAAVLLNLAIVPVSILFSHTVLLPLTHALAPRRELRWRLALFLIDWSSGVLPLVLTALGDSHGWRQAVLLSLLGAALLAVISRRVNIRIPAHHDDRLLESLNTPRQQRFLIWYRSSLMLGTAIAILAVDFRLFPRLYAKVETWGISLMDVGVGSFIFSSALVSKRARSPTAAASLSLVARLFQAVKGLTFVSLLGLGRFALIKLFNYQEHVSEYGLHWNFFMTIGAVALLDALFAISASSSAWVAAALMVVYEVALRAEGLQQWIFFSPRGLGFLSDNREGIFSLIGYFSIYLIAQALGSWLFQQPSGSDSTPRKLWWRRMWILFFLFLGLWFWQDVILDYGFGLQPSRRLCNVGYIILVLSCNCGLLAHLLMLDLILPLRRDQGHSRTGNVILHAVSTQRNSQLFVFLVANITTGVINVSFRTLYATPAQTVAILAGYSLFVSGSSLVFGKLTEIMR